MRLVARGHGSRAATWALPAVAVALLLGLLWPAGALGFGPVAGSPFVTSEQPYALAFSPNGKFLAAVFREEPAHEDAGGIVRTYSVNKATGAISPISSMEESLPPEQITFNPNGTLLAVGENAETGNFIGISGVTLLAVNPSTGVLEKELGTDSWLFGIPEEKEEILQPVEGMAFTHNGRFLAVSAGNENLAAPQQANSVLMFSVNETSGFTDLSPTTIAKIAAGSDTPHQLAFRPGGGVLAVAEANRVCEEGHTECSYSSGGVAALRVNETTGELHEIEGSPFGVSPAAAAWGLAWASNGSHLAVTDLASEQVSWFGFSEFTGVLGQEPGSPFGAIFAPYPVAINSAGTLAAVASADAGQIALYSVGSGLTPVAGSPFASGRTISIAFDPESELLAVANGRGFSIAIFSTAATPTVSAVSPGDGTAGGGTPVEITGTNFYGVTEVKFGPAAAKSFTVHSPMSVTAEAPPGTGTVNVTVTTAGAPTAGGTSAITSADQFTYVQRPAVSQVEPGTGPQAGGTDVTISGSGFIDVSAVKFGSSNAKSFTVNSPNSITAEAPPGSGRADVTVTDPEGTSEAGAADQYRYTPAGPPGLGTCTKVVSPSGAYKNAGCTKTAKKGGAYSWSPLGKELVSWGGKPLVLETAGKKIECEEASSFGVTLGGSKLLDPYSPGANGYLFLTGCSSDGVSCAAPGTEEISTRIEGFFAALTGSKKPKIGLELFAGQDEHGVLFEYHCGSTTYTVRGGVIASVPTTDEMTGTISAVFAAKKGKQRPEKLFGGSAETLETSTNGGPYVRTAVAGTLEIGTESGEAPILEVNATL